MKYVGTLSRIDERRGTSSRGEWCLYTLVLDTASGEVKIGVGFNRPKGIHIGQAIKVDASPNSKGYLDADESTISVADPSEIAEAIPPQSATNPAQHSPVDTRQVSIVSQSSYKTGADVLATALESGAIKLPSAKTAASDHLDLLLGALDEIAQHIFNKTMTGLSITEDATSPEEVTYDPTH